MAGVIGGEATGSDETTTTVFIECALFDPVRVALTGRRHQIVSDARQRFERGIDAALMPDALEAATAMVLELCGGEPGQVTEAGAAPYWERIASLRFERIAGLGGSDITADEAVSSLERLGFTVQQRDAARVVVSVPPWRNDIAATIELEQAETLDPAMAAKAAEGCAEIEPECDLVEEVLRLRGLDAVPAVSLPRASPVPQSTLTAKQTRTEIVRRTLAAQGLAECVTFSFMAQSEAALFGATPDALRLTNPIAADLDQLAADADRHAGARGQAQCRARLPRCGAVRDRSGVRRRCADERQRWIAAGLRAGATPRNWTAAVAAGRCDGRQGRSMDRHVRDRRAAGGAVGDAGCAGLLPSWALRHRAARDRRWWWAASGNCILGCWRRWTWPGPWWRSNSTSMPSRDPKRRRKSAPDLPTFQPIRRDFAFLVDAAVSADAVMRAARGAERALIAGVALFDVYQGNRLPAGKQSLAIEVTFQPRERTLTDAEIEAACQKVVAAVTKATGAALR